MNIVRNDIDAVNATVTVQVSKADYAEKVEKTLKEYKRKANISRVSSGHGTGWLIEKNVWQIYLGRRGKQGDERLIEQLPERK